MKDLNKKGFTLIETLVAMAVFAIIALGVYQAFIAAMRLVQTANLMVTSAALANEQFEIAHNLPYTDVGVVSGIPSGKLLAFKNVVRNHANFLVQTTVRNIDDPFDGILGGSPNDTSPADYKLVEITISLPGDQRFSPLSYTELVAPKSLENSSNNGALFVHVFDANGQPIQGANVHIENNFIFPAIIIDDITNKDGDLQIVDVPPGVEAYEISVSKPGLSSEKTYPSGAVANPNPIKKHATVAIQAVTETSFAIAETSVVNVEAVTDTCVPVGNISFDLRGAKLIGTGPDVIKYQKSSSTDVSGQKSISGLEWDNYTLTLTDSVYDLTGSISIIPFNLNPASTQEVKVVVAPKNPQTLLVSVKQGGTQLPLSGVEIKLEKGSTTEQLITGRGFLRQTDWSGGPGQNDFIDTTKYFNSDNNLSDNSPAGDIKLKNLFGLYPVSGAMTSSIFDTGSVSNFYQLAFLPHDQPTETGTSSVKFQIATNNDKSTWNYKGPDGSTSTFYTTANLNINPIHNNDRYFRYIAYLQTASSTFTPDISEVSFTFSSLCVPSGQAVFSGLAGGSYTLTATKTGYQTLIESINISSAWQQKEIILMPE